MKIDFPTNKADAKRFVAELGDRIDGVEDGRFDAKKVLRDAGANFTDDFAKNVAVAAIAIALWEGLHMLWKLF